ncbi:hypothetical protein D3C78_1251960 [compost metagenome]
MLGLAPLTLQVEGFSTEPIGRNFLPYGQADPVGILIGWQAVRKMPSSDEIGFQLLPDLQQVAIPGSIIKRRSFVTTVLRITDPGEERCQLSVQLKLYTFRFQCTDTELGIEGVRYCSTGLLLYL